MSGLKKLLAAVEEQSRAGNRREVVAALRILIKNRREYYRESVGETLQEAFSDALYKSLLLELDEEEEESIEIAELSYLGLGAVLEESGASPEHFKRRLLLLHYFSDFFTDALIAIFLSRYRKGQLLLARNLALECLEKMQLSDMFYLEENAAEFIDGDEQLSDACNAISAEHGLSADERKDAAFLHKVLYAYLKAKYKD